MERSLPRYTNVQYVGVKMFLGNHFVMNVDRDWIGVNNMKEYIKCNECPKCKPQKTLKNGVKWGVCGMGGNTVFLEPWKEKKSSGHGYIHHDISGCGMFEKENVEE